eukprot:CAMPEP_0204841970 /NCGR_PEP_ID=MMETSP1346-20131115/44334_1 /ASSEMBLY_ACC=CAM_ASM_000771 /TAXON_ID=215587 /ORGANISM="Aplanochytrium stocchinoi, Strain GSBS06" /LENGTH=234 /DNA_ID=CAMNT_0051980481 /DNA_START=86 /DNA_END=790 /DNA_ORIENTATION=+
MFGVGTNVKACATALLHVCMLYVVLGIANINVVSATEKIEATVRGKLTFGPKAAQSLNGYLPSIMVSLDGGKRTTYSRPDGSFEFRHVPAGTYHMSISHPMVFFEAYRLSVGKDGKVRASNVLTGKREKKEMVQSGSQPIVITALGTMQYFEPRKQLNVLSMFMNPMGIMMGFMMLMVFVMPKMMDSIDPEELKKMQEEQRKQQQDVDPSKMLNGAMANFLGVPKPDDSDEDSD